MGSKLGLLGYVAPLLILWVTLMFWRHYDATGIDLRRDRKSPKRRVDFRAGIRWPVSIETVIGSIQGRTRNVSISGATLVSLQPLIRGEIVPVTLKSSVCTMRLRGEVMWIETFYPSMSRTPHKAIGIHFRGLSEENRDFLARSVETWRKVEEQRKVEAPLQSFLARWLGRHRARVEQVAHGLKSFDPEGALRCLRQRMDGVFCQALALFPPYRAAEAPVRADGKKTGTTRSR